MTDQPERVGFEAYFETDQFLKDVKRFTEAINNLTSSFNKLDAIITDFGKNAKSAFSSIGVQVDKMSQNTEHEMEVMKQAISEGGILIGEQSSVVQKASKESEKAGDKIAQNFLIGMTSSLFSASSKKALGSAIGSLLGAVAGAATGIPGGAAIGGALGEILGRLLSGPGPISKAIKVVVDGFNLLKNVGKTTFNIIGIAIKGALVLVGSLATAVGGVLVGGFLLLKRTVSSIVGNFEEIFESVKNLEVIEVGLEAISRAALVAQGDFENATDAIAAAIPVANQIKDALVAISLTSPFPVEDVNSLFRTIAAFGIALDTSLDLTKAMIDLGAATGFGSDILTRIGKNFAQVARNNRIFQRDIYELANAGIDLHAILDSQLNVTVDEMNELLAAGKVNADDLTIALIGFASQYYGGAAEDLSKTLQGLENRFGTLKTLMLNDFVQPILKRVVPAIETFIDALAMVVDTGVFQKLGELVAWMGQTIVGNVDWTTETVAEGILKFILWLLQQTNKMLQYGYDMMTQWGFGLLRGAADAIAAIANFINRALSALFSTHSPPKILPLIDIWGAGLIEAWLTGMKDADFGILDDVISPIRKALSAMGVDEDIITQNVQNVAKLLSKSLKAGQLESGLLGFISNIAGPMGKSIAELTSLNFDLAKAIKEVEKAQKALDDANKMYDEMDERVQRLVREYNALLRAGASDDVLDSKLAEINATQDQRSEAARLIEQHEEELDIAEEQRDRIEEQTKAQQELVKTTLDLVKEIEKVEEGIDTVQGAAAELASEFENVWGGVGDFAVGTIEFSEEINNLLAGIDLEIQNIKTSWMELVSAFMAELGFEMRTIYPSTTKGMAFSGEGETEGFEKKWVPTGEGGIFSGLGEAFSGLGDTIIDILTNEIDWDAVGETAKEMATDVGKSIIDGIIQGMKDKVNEMLSNVLNFIVWLIISEFQSQLVIQSPSQLMATEVGEPIGEGILSGMGQGVLNAISTTVTDIWNWISETFKNIFGIKTYSEKSATEIGEPTGEGILKGLWNYVTDNISKKATDIWEKIKQAFSDFKDKAFSIGEDILQGLLDGIANIGNLGGWAAGIITKIINALKFASDTESPSKKFASEIGVPFAQGVLKGFKDEIANMKKDAFMAVDSLANYRPTPTASYTPSAINNSNVTYNMNMGGNTIQTPMDMALYENQMMRQLRHASNGV